MILHIIFWQRIEAKDNCDDDDIGTIFSNSDYGIKLLIPDNYKKKVEGKS